MPKVKITTIQRPQQPKNEDEFVKYQRAYAAYLRKLNAARKAGKAKGQVKAEMKRIQNRWIAAGIMDSDGSINKRYRNIIINK